MWFDQNPYPPSHRRCTVKRDLGRRGGFTDVVEDALECKKREKQEKRKKRKKRSLPSNLQKLNGMVIFSPLFTPLGIHWQETVALLFGFIAKEIVIGALAVIYGGADLKIQVAAHITPLQGLSFMLFTLLYALYSYHSYHPCRISFMAHHDT